AARETKGRETLAGAILEERAQKEPARARRVADEPDEAGLRQVAQLQRERRPRERDAARRRGRVWCQPLGEGLQRIRWVARLERHRLRVGEERLKAREVVFPGDSRGF